MYKIISESTVQRISDGVFIPTSDDNMDYQAYVAWVEGGGVPDPADPAPVYVPQSASRYQARAALLEAGLLDAVESHFDALPESSLDKLAWKEAPTVLRTSDAVASAAAALGITEEQLDSLFTRAAQFT